MRTIVPILGVLLCATGLPAADYQPEVLVEVDRTQIYEGESILYRVTLNHVENPSPPELQVMDDFEVASLGERSLDSTQITIINGRRTETVRRGRQYNYHLTPRRTGLLKIPGPVVKVDDRVLRGREVTVNVAAPDDQDVVIMKITSAPESVYPTQPFAVTLSIVVKELPEPYSERDPVAVQSTPPRLEIPWVDDDQLPKGVEAVRDWQRWLGPLENRSGAGFGINNLGHSQILSLFDQRPSTFYPRPQRIKRPDKSGREVGYRQYELTRRFVPKRIGRYRFGPVTLKGQFAASYDPDRGMQAQRVYVVAPQITVTVKDVPEEGRPDSYVGAVGDFRLRGELHPAKAKVGDPMTLTLTLSGEGSLDGAFPPDLMRVEEIAEQFKVYEATESTEGNSRQFTYSLRPLKEGIKEFPAVPVSYFDVNTDKYVTLKTDPVTIEVAKADRLSGHQIAYSRRGSLPAGGDVQVREEGIFANITELSAVRDQSIRPVRWLAGLGGVAGLYLAVAVVVWQVRRRGGDVALQRRSTAASRARARLRKASSEMKAGGWREGADHVEVALIGLVADMADLPEAGLTPREVELHLQCCSVDEDLIGRLHVVLETCEAARYGAPDAAVGDLGREAEALLGPLLKSLKANRRSRRCAQKP